MNRTHSKFFPTSRFRSAKSLSGRRNLFALAIAASFLVPAPSALAATINVNGTTCTLAEAIDNANANSDNNRGGNGCTAGSGADTIHLLADALIEDQLQIDSIITLEGNDHTVARSGTSDFQPIFVVGAAGFANEITSFTLNRTNVTGGVSRFGGGGGMEIVDSSTVTVSNSTLSGNTAASGGGIFCSDFGGDSGSTLNVVNSTISGNQARDGGGIYVGADCSARIINSTISGNIATTGRGGGIFVDGSGAIAVLADSTISGNAAGFAGGGLTADDDGTGTLLRSIVSGNRSPSGSGVSGFLCDWGHTLLLKESVWPSKRRCWTSC